MNHWLFVYDSSNSKEQREMVGDRGDKLLSKSSVAVSVVLTTVSEVHQVVKCILHHDLPR